MDKRDRYELKIAVLLLDCGKVITPVHVVDKATKLHTLCDRINLIDTRFEVPKRDRKIAALLAQLNLREVRDATAESRLWAQCRTQIEALDGDRAFLRAANKGAERMSDADLKRVFKMGVAKTWRNVAGVEAEFLSADEIENLIIRAGTMTAVERETINYHAVATIKMLEQLRQSTSRACRSSPVATMSALTARAIPRV